MSYFIPKKDNLSVYNPFAGYGSLALSLPKSSNYFGQEINKKVCALARLRMLAYDCSDSFTLKCEDSIYSWSTNNLKLYDFVTFNPPYNLKYNNHHSHPEGENIFFNISNANSFIVEQCFDRLKQDGKMVFVMPDSFLYNNSKEDKKFRKYLIENNFIDLIISLPPGILDYTSISVNLIVLSKKFSDKNNQILFIDARDSIIRKGKRKQALNVDDIIRLIKSQVSSKNNRKVETSEIIKNNFNLLTNRYLIPDLELNSEQENNLIALDNLLKPIKRVKSEIKEGKFIRIRDLNNNTFSYKTSFDNVESREIPKFASLLPENSLLLATVWKSIKPTFYKYSKEPIYYSYPDILVCKVDSEKIDIDYLILELNKKYVSKQVSRYTIGNAIPRISKNDLLKIKLSVPSLQEQKNLVLEYKEKIILKEAEKFKALKEEYGIDIADQNSFLRHQISGSLKNVRISFNSLKSIFYEKIIKDNPDILDLKVSEKSRLTLGKYFDIIDRDLNSIHQSVIITGKELDFTEFKGVEIDLMQFIIDYYNELRERTKIIHEITIQDVDASEDLTNAGMKKAFVMGDKDFLRKMFNNIVDNAEKHAFNDSFSIKNKLDISIYFDFERMQVEIEFSNTGKPVPKQFNLENAIKKGRSFGKNGGNGIGLWYVNEIMKYHYGVLYFQDESEPEWLGDEWVSSFNFVFPIKLE